MSQGLGEPATPAGADGPIRVMVVDDSAVIRGLVCRWLEEDGEIAVVARAQNGEVALRQAAEHRPDIVVLDIEMPVMDGLTALPKLLQLDRDMKVVVSSTLTQRNAEISLEALAKGAADYVAKPSATREMTGSLDFRRELIGKVKALAAARRMRPRGGGAAVRSGATTQPLKVARRPEGGLYGQSPITLRRGSRTVPRVIGIGSSTGGPQALMALLGQLAGKVQQPILITQHMPATFTKILAEHLRRMAGEPCGEGRDGEPVLPGHVYLAPGNYHMTVQLRAGSPVIALNQDAPENFCRPSVDPMFRSLAAAFGPAVLAVVLTGMGHDGLAGASAIVEAGGSVLGQDEATSVVWGMPGAVATGGLCSAVLPLPEIGPAILRSAGGRAP